VHVACIGKLNIVCNILIVKSDETRSCKDLSIDGWIILKLFLNVKIWTGLAG
jgi:hypothetical protein